MAPKVARTARKPCGIKLGSKLLGLPSDVDKQLAVTPFPPQLPPLSRCSCTGEHLQRIRHAPQRRYNSPRRHNSPHDAMLCSQWMHARKAFPDVMRWNSFPLEIPHRESACAGNSPHTPPAPACQPTVPFSPTHSPTPSLSLSLSLPPCSVHVTRQQQQQLMILRSARNVEFI